MLFGVRLSVNFTNVMSELTWRLFGAHILLKILFHLTPLIAFRSPNYLLIPETNDIFYMVVLQVTFVAKPCTTVMKVSVSVFLHASCNNCLIFSFLAVSYVIESMIYVFDCYKYLIHIYILYLYVIYSV